MIYNNDDEIFDHEDTFLLRDDSINDIFAKAWEDTKGEKHRFERQVLYEEVQLCLDDLIYNMSDLLKTHLLRYFLNKVMKPRHWLLSLSLTKFRVLLLILKNRKNMK